MNIEYRISNIEYRNVIFDKMKNSMTLDKTSLLDNFLPKIGCMLILSLAKPKPKWLMAIKNVVSNVLLYICFVNSTTPTRLIH